MKIKHSKYKNTGLIFEILVKQITMDTLAGKDSPAIGILRKYYSGKSYLVQEWKLYRLLATDKQLSQSRAEAILSTITEVYRKINTQKLKEEKYKLISEIKKEYGVEEFFAIPVKEYKPLAALYCLLESQSAQDIVDPSFLVQNKTVILEHLTKNRQEEKEVRESLVEEYSKYDKDLRLLTFKILLEKFNEKYTDLLPEQKQVLKHFITSGGSTSKLRGYINEQLQEVRKQIGLLKHKPVDEVVRIKLDEIYKGILDLSPRDKIEDTHLVKILQYQELISELRRTK